MKASPISTIFMIISPCIFLFLGYLSFQGLSSLKNENDWTKPKLHEIRSLPCTDSLGSCFPMFLYAPNDPYHEAIMQRFSRNWGLSPSRDLRGFGSIDEMTESMMVDQQRLRHDRSETFGIAFNTFGKYNPATNLRDLFRTTNATYYSAWSVQSYSLGGKYAVPHLIPDLRSLTIQNDLNTAVLQTKAHYMNLPIPNPDLKFSLWPAPADPIETYDNEKNNAQERKLQTGTMDLAFIIIGMAFMMNWAKKSVADEST